MNKEITIYELLGLIKDGQAPKKIKFYDRIFEYEYQLKDYYYESYSLFEDGIEIISDSLNDKVEIIEEDKKIEKLDLNGYNDIYTGIKEEWMSGEDAIIVKINELIDEVNKLKDGKE